MITALSNKAIKDQHQGIATVLAFALLPLSGFATDIYIPSLPSMAGQLQVSNIAVQMTLTLFLISYGVTQLFIGSLLDSFGRYKIGLWSLVIFAAASVIIAFTHNIWLIFLMRIIHGITVGGIIVAKRAYFIDVFSGEKLKGYLSMFSIIWSTGPIIAPFVGGYLESSFGWRSNFYFLGGFAAVLAFLEYLYSGETIQNVAAFKLKSIAKTYAEMMGTMSFSLGLVMIGLAYSMVMIYNMTGPFIIEHTFGRSPVIAGYTSLILGFAWMTGGILGKATISKPFLGRMVVNMVVQVMLGILMLLAINFFSGGMLVMVIFAFLIHVDAGYTFNNFFTYCLSRFPKNAGIASGLSGGINYVIVSIMSYSVVAILPAKDAHHLSWSYLLLIAASVLVMLVLKFKKSLDGV